MKEQMKNMFAQVTMPEETERRIRQTMEESRRPRNGKRTSPGRITAAAAVMLALILTISPQARATVNDLVRYVISDSFFVREEESGELLEFEGDGHMFVEAGDGKMYFSVDGQYIDITDKTSMERPYIYTYVDDAQVEHLLIIGGVPENFGVCEFYRDATNKEKSWNGWIGGYSENYYDNQNESAYPWVAAGWEELDIPWPMPG